MRHQTVSERRRLHGPGEQLQLRLHRHRLPRPRLQRKHRRVRRVGDSGQGRALPERRPLQRHAGRLPLHLPGRLLWEELPDGGSLRRGECPIPQHNFISDCAVLQGSPCKNEGIGVATCDLPATPFLCECAAGWQGRSCHLKVRLPPPDHCPLYHVLTSTLLSDAASNLISAPRVHCGASLH